MKISSHTPHDHGGLSGLIGLADQNDARGIIAKDPQAYLADDRTILRKIARGNLVREPRAYRVDGPARFHYKYK